MAYEFKLPDIGEGVVEGEIVRWLVKEGESLALDQPMVEVMTDKATVEIPAPRAGTVVRRRFAEGDVCPVGNVLIEIQEAGSASHATNGSDSTALSNALANGQAEGGRLASTRDVQNANPAGVQASAPPVAVAPSAPKAPSAPSTAATAVLATPATRKLARELGVDLGAVAASGREGRITSQDVQNAASGISTSAATRAADGALPPPKREPGDVRIPFRGMRRQIASRLITAKHRAAHFTYVEEVDATNLVQLRDKANKRLSSQGIKISFLPFFVKATVDALKRYPQLNATLDEQAGEIVQRTHYNIGVAAATQDGLLVPVVKDADKRSLVDLGREVERLAEAARAGQAHRDDLTGSTFTITSLGTLGGILATPIVNYPEVAIMGIHKITRRPMVIDEKVEIRDMLNLSLSVDHRLVDGREAALFVAAVKEAIETPGLLFLESV